MSSSGGHFQTVADDLSFPSTNVAATCTLHAASNAANTAYTATTVIDSNGAPWNQGFQGHAVGAFANIVATDIAVTSAGLWAVVQSKTAPGTVTVDKWRALKTHVDMNPADSFIGLPAAATQCAIFTAMREVNAAIWRLERINVVLAITNETIVITDPGGNVKYTITLPAAGFVPTSFDFSPGLEFPYPFGVKGSGTSRAIVSYSIT